MENNKNENNNNNKDKQWLPSPKQIKFVDLYTTGMFLSKICKKIGISMVTQWRWRNDKNFLNYINSRIEEILYKSMGKRLRVITQKALKGHFGALKTLLEMDGLYTPSMKMQTRQDIKIKTEDRKHKRQDLEDELRDKIQTIRNRIPLAEQKARLETELEKVVKQIKDGGDKIKTKFTILSEEIEEEIKEEIKDKKVIKK